MISSLCFSLCHELRKSEQMYFSLINKTIKLNPFFIIHGKMLTFVFVDKLLSFASLIPAMNYNVSSWWGLVTALGGCGGCGGCGGWQCVCVFVCVSNSLWPHELQCARLLCPWNFPGKNTRVDCHFLLQRIFLTQELNPHLLHLLHWKANSLPLRRLGSSGQGSRNAWFIRYI